MFNECPKIEFLNIIQIVFSMQENFYEIFEDEENLHLVISADFYYQIIDMNVYFQVIDENVTIV